MSKQPVFCFNPAAFVCPGAHNLTPSRAGVCPIMIVTDVAARGLDVPDLDCVINYDCPAKAKLFVHRVGRAARAGRSGFAYSLIGSDEVAFLPDLKLFLGRQDVSADSCSFFLAMVADVASTHPCWLFFLFVMLVLHIHAGRVPSAALDDWVEHVNAALNDGELSLQKDVCERSMKLCVNQCIRVALLY